MGSAIVTLTVALSSLLNGTPNQICYEQLGCFSNAKPWASMTRPVPLPQPPSAVCTSLVFFNRHTFNETIEIYPNISTRLLDLYNPNLQTYILCHGWANSGYYMWEMAQAIITTRKDANILSIDWGPSAELMDYLQAVSDTRVAAAVVRRVVDYLLALGAHPRHMHFIGHSLGAHILAYVARGMTHKVDRLTGMDVAGPLFEGESGEVRFRSSDAEYTEALHTSPGISGYLRPVAHVDYYFNAGIAQAGCVHTPRTIFNLTVPESPLVKISPMLPLICDHGSSYVFYKEAILNKGCFIGRRITLPRLWKEALRTLELESPTDEKYSDGCNEEDCTHLSFEAPVRRKRGVFLIPTNKKSPFCNKKFNVRRLDLKKRPITS